MRNAGQSRSRAQRIECRACVAALEPRQLLAAFNASFNFQPHGETPSGWIPDTGAKFSVQGELSYGWNKDNGRCSTDQ